MTPEPPVSAPPVPAALEALRRPRRVRLFWLAAMVVAMVVAAALSLGLGVRAVGWADLVAGLAGRTETLAQAVVSLRAPRTALALLAGGALGLAGAVMQGVTRNPLADPGLLGVNAGAALAVVTGMALFGIETVEAFLWAAILGAGLAAGFVYAVGSLGRGGATPLRLALAGAATAIAAEALCMAILLPRNDIAGGMQAWRVGGVGGASWDGIAPAAPFLAAGFALCLASARDLDLLALGEETAAGLGARVARARALAALGAVLLCGAATAMCGPIGFVGLAAPHVCRRLAGPDHRWLLPFSALNGAVLLVGADVLGRVVARPSELDVGVVTAFLGAPMFLWIVRRGRAAGL